MEKTKQNKKVIITLTAFLIVLILITSVFFEITFSGSPLESTKVLDWFEYPNGINKAKDDIIWSVDLESPENIKPLFDLTEDEDAYYLLSNDYYVKVSNVGIDVLDCETNKITNIVQKNTTSGDSLKLSILLTENELVFSAYEIDTESNIVKSAENGTYKYHLESGKMEKICNGTFKNLKIINEHILIGTDYSSGILKIIFMF